MALPETGYDVATITNPSSALTDFVLLIDLSLMSADFKLGWNTSENGYGRAAKDSGPTELPCDWINLDHTAKTGWLRVRWSGTLASSGTQRLRVYPPNTSNVQYAHNDTYGSDNVYDSNWITYLPVDETSGTLYDRTANSNDASNVGASPTAGQIGGGYECDGSASYLQISNPGTVLNGQNLTLNVWAYINDIVNSFPRIIDRGYSSQFAFYLLEDGADLVVTWALATTGGSVDHGLGGAHNEYELSTWTHFVLTYDGSDVRVYVDSSLVETFGVGVSGGLSNSANNIRIGERPDAGDTRNLDGIVDEIQIHKTNRDGNWIGEEYAQSNDNAAFWGTWVWNAGTSDSNGRSLTVNNGVLINMLKRRKLIMATRNYPISDVWLRTQDENAPEYCDIQEIRNDPHGNARQPANVLHGAPNYPSSAYLTWVLANDPRVFTLQDGSTPNRMDHINAALFDDTGIRVGDTDDGNNIQGMLKGSNIITTGEYFGGINHEEIYRRIYRDGTTVEKLWFVGN